MPWTSTLDAKRFGLAVIHLDPLPGSPRFEGDFASVLTKACAEARQFENAGFDGLIIENHGDAPFHAIANPPETHAALALAAARLKETTDLPLGLNILRNDARAALGIASVLDLPFIRVNVLSGTTATDQGIIEGRARDLLDARRLLRSTCAIAADVDVKYGTPFLRTAIEDKARASLQRGGADAVIISGSATGQATSQDDLAAVRRSCPQACIMVGSGVSAETVASSFEFANGLIVGSTLKEDGYVENPVSAERLKQFAEALATAKN